MQNVFIIGSKGIPSAYGGFESFVDRLTFFKKSEHIKYHVSCAVEPEEWIQQTEKEFSYHGARCFRIKWKKLGPARAIFYDLDAFGECIAYIKANNIENPIVYVLACRIGPFFHHYVKKIHKVWRKV